MFKLAINNDTYKLVALLVISVYLLVPMSLFHHMMQMDNINTPSNTDCVYMTGENSMCSMNIFDHLSILKSMSVAFPSFLSMFFVVILSALIYALTKNIFLSDFHYFVKQKYKNLFILYQELFSRGLLNGKAF